MTCNETYRRTCRTWISPLAVSSSSSKTARFSTSPASRISDSSARHGCFSRCLHRVLTSTARSDLCKKGRTLKRYTSAVLMAIGVRFEAFHRTFDVKNVQHESGVSVNCVSQVSCVASSASWPSACVLKQIKVRPVNQKPEPRLVRVACQN